MYDRVKDFENPLKKTLNKIKRDKMMSKSFKVTKNTANADTLYRQLKADLAAADNVCYSMDEIRLWLNGHLVTWQLKGKKLWRYSDFTWTASSEVIHSFKYQGVFAGYMAFEIVGKKGPLADMIQIRTWK